MSSPCSKPWPINSRLVFFLPLKGVFINSSKEKLLSLLLKFYGTILIVFSFTNTVSTDNKSTTDNCQCHSRRRQWAQNFSQASAAGGFPLGTMEDVTLFSIPQKQYRVSMRVCARACARVRAHVCVCHIHMYHEWWISFASGNYRLFPPEYSKWLFQNEKPLCVWMLYYA